ncbi:MAG: hypothetical protein IT422_19615 [Pirellulaceae bacterium]|nr:hypothetical protein [Pirellulaceae bacterium]
MSNSEPNRPNPKSALAVDMSSEAIAQRLREAAELNELGLSLARAKPIRSPSGQTLSNAVHEDRPSVVDGKSSCGKQP